MREKVEYSNLDSKRRFSVQFRFDRSVKSLSVCVCVCVCVCGCVGEFEFSSVPFCSVSCSIVGSRRWVFIPTFEDKCEYGHELPNEDMKSVNVISITVLTTPGRGKWP